MSLCVCVCVCVCVCTLSSFFIPEAMSYSKVECGVIMDEYP
jgi:hypothetical protein